MDNNCVPEAVCRERLKTSDEHFKRCDERLKIGEGKIDTMEKAIVYLTEATKQTKEEISDHDRRLETLEHRPGVFWDKIVFGVLGTVGGTLGALLFNVFK